MKKKILGAFLLFLSGLIFYGIPTHAQIETLESTSTKLAIDFSNPKKGNVSILIHGEELSIEKFENLKVELMDITPWYHSIEKDYPEMNRYEILSKIIDVANQKDVKYWSSNKGEQLTYVKKYTTIKLKEHQTVEIENLPSKTEYEGKKVDAIYLVVDKSSELSPLIIRLPYLLKDEEVKKIDIVPRLTSDHMADIYNLSLVEVEKKIGYENTVLYDFGASALTDSEDHLVSPPYYGTSVGDVLKMLLTIDVPKDITNHEKYGNQLSCYAIPSSGLQIQSMNFSSFSGRNENQNVPIHFGGRKFKDIEYSADFVRASDCFLKEGKIEWKSPMNDFSKFKTGDAARIQLPIDNNLEKYAGEMIEFMLIMRVTDKVGVDMFNGVTTYLEVPDKNGKSEYIKGSTREVASCGQRFVIVDANKKSASRKEIAFHLYRNIGTKEAPILGEEIFAEKNGGGGITYPSLTEKNLFVTSSRGELSIGGLGLGNYVLVQEKSSLKTHTVDEMIPFILKDGAYSDVKELYFTNKKEKDVNKRLTDAYLNGPWAGTKFIEEYPTLTAIPILVREDGILPSTFGGEYSSPFIYIGGATFIALCGGTFVLIKKGRKKGKA